MCQYAKHNFYMSFPVSQADLIQFWHTVLSSEPPSENGKLSSPLYHNKWLELCSSISVDWTINDEMWVSSDTEPRN